MQGSRGRAAIRWKLGGDAGLRRFLFGATALAILSLAAGCSSSSPPLSSSSSAPPPGQTAANAQQAQQQPGTVGSVRQSYSNFLQAFRDPDPDQAANDTRAVRQSPASSTPAQQSYAPHPPNTYVPSQQPYMPPQGQAAYATQPQTSAQPPGRQGYAQSPSSQAAQGAPTQAATVASAPAPMDASDSGAYPKQSLVDLFRRDAAEAKAAPASDADLAANAYPYPKQSLFHWGRDDDSRQANVPHPPSTYTPAGQPYTPPPGQASVPPPPGQPAQRAPAQTATATPAAPAPMDASDSGAYPKQSLFDLFSSK